MRLKDKGVDVYDMVDLFKKPLEVLTHIEDLVKEAFSNVVDSDPNLVGITKGYSMRYNNRKTVKEDSDLIYNIYLDDIDKQLLDRIIKDDFNR